MEAFLRVLLPRILPRERTFEIHALQGKAALLRKRPDRLRGYAGWLPGNWRIVVVADRDDDDCLDLKRTLDVAAAQARLPMRSTDRTAWRLVNRIAIKELEAWYFGDWDAVRRAYPRVLPTVPNSQPYRDPETRAIG